MALVLDGTNGVSLVQDGVVTAADLSSTLDLTGKTVTLPAGTGGKVLQVVNYVHASGEVSTTSTSLSDTGLTATITPSSTSSKILIVMCQSIASQGTGGARVAIFRDATLLYNLNEKIGFTFDSGWNYIGTTSFTYLDSPATTSAVTYKTQFKASTSGQTVVAQVDNDDSSITVMEIAG